MSLYSKLKTLCAAPSVSGREVRVRELIKAQIEPLVDEVHVDALGNLLAVKKGSGADKRIMLCAHLDEIGFIVNFIEDDGSVRVAPIGGVHFVDLAYGRVVSENGTVGLLVPEAKVKLADISADKMYVDIGASSKKEAERKVKIGDFFVIEPSLTRLLGKRVAGHPIDDRVGCLILLEVAKRIANIKTDADICFAFSVQEEVGCRGSAPATYSFAPTEAICVDVTATGDVKGAEPMACSLGGGAAVKIKDRSVICHEEIVKALLSIAKEKKIPVQREVLTFGGTDTSSMQLTAGGAMAGAVSIPSRYIHTGVEMCDLSDVEACIDLIENYILARG